VKPNQKPKPDERELLIQRLGAYVSLFQNTREGRAVLDDLKKSLDGPSFRPGIDTHTMAWLEGRRSVYTDIVASVGSGVAMIESGGQDQTEPETEAPSTAVEGGALTAPLD
jgi:hypothetical protein